MSMAFTHFSVGILCGGLLAYLSSRRDHALLIGIFGGFWAMVPDTWRVAPYPKPIHNHPVSNLFFGHHYLDTVVDTGDSKAVAMTVGAALFIAMLLHAGILYHRAR